LAVVFDFGTEDHAGWGFVENQAIDWCFEGCA
jgi:hypothetical protein